MALKEIISFHPVKLSRQKNIYHSLFSQEALKHVTADLLYNELQIAKEKLLITGIRPFVQLPSISVAQVRAPKPDPNEFERDSFFVCRSCFFLIFSESSRAADIT